MLEARRLVSLFVHWTVSPWLAEIDDPAPSLDDSIDVDIAVIGAGYTGLSSALALAEEGHRVAVLEAEVAAFGASGRNAGHLTPTIGKDIPTLELMFGQERTKELLDFAEGSIEHTEALIRKYDISCDYEAVGNVFGAIHEKQFAGVEKAARACERVGMHAELLDENQLRERGFPRVIKRGVFEPRGGVLNPAKLARGLRRAALASGVQLFEKTPVTAMDPGRIVTLTTPGGEVRANHVVVGTNAYPSAILTEGFEAPVPKLARLQVQLFWTEPLTDDQLGAVDWRARAGVYSAHEVLENYRLTADNRVLGGTKYVRYGYDNRPLSDVDQKIASKVETAFRARFPELDQVPIARHWGGPIGFAIDFLPQVGRAGPHHNILYAVGYAGHGLAQASYAGQIIVDLLNERDGLGRVLWLKPRRIMPPEPLRWLVVRSILGVLEWSDERVDRVAEGERE